VDEEASALHLLDVVESDQADVGIGEGLGAGSNLLQHLRAVSAAEHGELPHGPVAVIVVVDGNITHSVGVGGLGVGGLGARELEAGSVAIADNVVDLLGDLGVGESGQVGEGLEEPELVMREGMRVRKGGGKACFVEQGHNEWDRLSGVTAKTTSIELIAP